MTIYTEMQSPIGPITIASNGRALTMVALDAASEVVRGDWRRDDVALQEAVRQLAAYFAGELREFTLPLEAAGTPFQQGVWRVLREIPFGATWSYGQLAAKLGAAGSARAVGAANGRNPIAILVPCHRVIGADGSLTGYAGGMERKRWLLEHEARACGAATQTALALA